jgi:hypothetical protein
MIEIDVETIEEAIQTMLKYLKISNSVPALYCKECIHREWPGSVTTPVRFTSSLPDASLL